MKKLSLTGLVLACMFLFTFMSPALSQAADLVYEGDQLMGATGVDVLGSFYDVEFLDGSCNSIWGGGSECTADSFTFQSVDGATALLASQALQDQVFIPGSDPYNDLGQVNGLAASWGALIYTPHGIREVGFYANEIYAAFLYMSSSHASDYTQLSGDLPIDFDLGPYDAYVFAQWSPVAVVPEPISSTLFIIGGAALGFRRFRKKFKT